ncbi:MAG: hypothetical protein RJB13_764, partial [Pseudomonadota bacterium]
LHSIYLAMIAYEDANDSFPLAAAACADGLPCGPAAATQITFRQTPDSKYVYGFNATQDMFIAGAASRRPILRNQRDRWAVNTNKVMCSSTDVTDQSSVTAPQTGAGSSGCVRIRGANVAVADTGQPGAPAVAQDAKE